MKIIFTFSCSGMFRNVPCSGFYRRPVKSTVMPADYRESRRVLPCGSLLKITLQDKIDLWAFLSLIFVKFSPFYYKFKVRFQWKFYTFFITRLGCYYLGTGSICFYLRGRGTAKETCQSSDFKSSGVCSCRKTWVSDFNVHIPYNLGGIL